MKSVTVISGTIALKIWILALIVNTIGGALLLAGLRFDFLDFFVFGGLFGLIFSFPFFLLVWIILYCLFKRRYSSKEVFVAVLVACMVLAALAYGSFWLAFSFFNNALLAILAIISSGTGVVLSYGNIKRCCIQREEQETGIKQIGQEETHYNS